ncbi:MAG TPA: RnfABCDGE type electron transport complex subunit B [Firmicutes bacterium]|nr:RnfABCDGE type electron transport complex subunit B [Bacillota bacterium]
MSSVVLVSLASMAGVGILLGVVIAMAHRKFAVKSDPRIDEVEGVLPGVNCGACGYPGCRAMAEAIAKGEAPVDGCPVGGAAVAALVAKIMGVELKGGSRRLVALVRCGGGRAEARETAEYVGLDDCRAAQLLGGNKGCQYGCLGLASCVKACPFNAMFMNDNGLPVVDKEACTACGLCVKACPRNLIALVPDDMYVHVLCRSYDTGRVVRSNCQVGCIGCKACERVCEDDAIHVTDLLAEIDYDKCTNCGKCAEVCPTKAIVIEEGRFLVTKKAAS